MKLIPDNRCSICNEVMQQKSPVILVADKYAAHLHCIRHHCIDMTIVQTEKFIEKKLAERKAKQ